MYKRLNVGGLSEKREKKVFCVYAIFNLVKEIKLIRYCANSHVNWHHREIVYYGLMRTSCVETWGLINP